MKEGASTRDLWGSKAGFVLAAAGSAIGLGNIWRFPTVTGENGGAIFVFIYLLCVLLIGLPVMILELSIGRCAQSDPVGAFKRLAPGTWWKALGGVGVFTGFMILGAYSVVAGWTLKYIHFTVTNQFAGAESDAIQALFTQFVSDGPAVIFYQLLFMALTVSIVIGGVREGIEKASKILMPALLGLLVLLVLRSVTLPGAGEGILFYLKPDLTKVNFSVLMSALGQAFFSLSLGMGAMITYGSYMSREENLISGTVYVSFSDTLIAFLAGFAIFPALFSVPGLTPQAGPGLIFLVLPNIFNAIPLGYFFGALFFLLLSIAALTSTISLLEVVTAYFIDQRGWKRKNAALAIGLAAFVAGIPSALSTGSVESLTNLSVLDLVFLYFGEIALVSGALLMCLFVAWKWGTANALKEMRADEFNSWFPPVWSILVRYLCPVAITTILLTYIF